MMEAPSIFVTPVNAYQTKQRLILEDSHFHLLSWSSLLFFSVCLCKLTQLLAHLKGPRSYPTKVFLDVLKFTILYKLYLWHNADK
jgi:hypothetical protein